MRLYYTGAVKFNTPQTDPSASLGHYISSSLVPNGEINALFGAISQYLSNNNQRQVRAVALKNETTAMISGATLYYNYLCSNPISSYKMAIVLVGETACGDIYMETVTSENALPLNATFIDNRGIENQLTLPDIEPNKYLGIWIVREINANRAKNGFACEQMFDRFAAIPIPQTFSITTIADVAGSLNGTYFTFDTPTSSFIVWYSVSGNGTLPTDLQGKEPIKISINQDDNATTVALKTSTQLNNLLDIRGECTSSSDLDVFTVMNQQAGLCSEPTVQTTGFSILTIIQGVSSEVEQLEEIEVKINW